MRSTRLDTAILLFSRSAGKESIAKPLALRSNGAKRAIAGQFIRHARCIANQSGFPVYFISENQQQGNTFGDRFANAFEQVFALGFDRVISIGNDCPTLTTRDLQHSAKMLESNAAVFGPSTDGGAYLVGLCRSVFDTASFAALNWQSGQTLADLKRFAEQAFCLLAEKSDVDSADDLKEQVHDQAVPLSLKITLLNLLKPTLANCFKSLVFTPKSACLSALALRGPPLLSTR